MSSSGNHAKGQCASTVATSKLTRTAEPQSQLDFELDFFTCILERNPNFVEVLRIHGNNLTLCGRYADGLKIDRKLVALRPQDAHAHYNLACSYSLLKKIDLSLQALRKALELGYRDYRYLHEDRDLASVRRDPRFGKLLGEFETR